MPELPAARPARQISSQCNARQPDLLEFFCGGISVWSFGRHICLHRFECAHIRGVATHSTRQAHTEGPLGLVFFAVDFLTSLLCRIPFLHCLLPRELSPQNFQQIVRPCRWPKTKKFWTVRSSNHQIVCAADSTIDDVASN